MSLQEPFSTRSWPVLPNLSSATLKPSFRTMKTPWAFLPLVPFLHCLLHLDRSPLGMLIASGQACQLTEASVWREARCTYTHRLNLSHERYWHTEEVGIGPLSMECKVWEGKTVILCVSQAVLSGRYASWTVHQTIKKIDPPPSALSKFASQSALTFPHSLGSLEYLPFFKHLCPFAHSVSVPQAALEPACCLKNSYRLVSQSVFIQNSHFNFFVNF